MKMKQIVIVLLVLIMALSGCSMPGSDDSQVEESKNNQAEKEKPVFRMIDEAKEEVGLRKLAKRERQTEYVHQMFEINQEKHLLEKTYYVAKNTVDIMSGTDESAIVVGNLTKEMPVISTQIIDDQWLEFKYQSDAGDYGYIPMEKLYADKTDFMYKKYDGVDYSKRVKVGSFESNPKRKVRGVYLTASSAANNKLQEIIDLINRTELNAVVLDVKNDSGNMLYHSEVAEKYCPSGNSHNTIKDIESLMKKFKDNDIYVIGRIVTFKSPKYAVAHPDRAIVYEGTNKLLVHRRDKWASPYDRRLWDYNIEVGKEAARYGFNEIQFDYVRFPAVSSKGLDMRNKNNENKAQVIYEFLERATKELNEEEVYVAADVFGWASTAVNDVGIGQHWESVTNVIDYICPMFYPSHYGTGIYGLKVPDAHPYKTIDQATKDANRRNGYVYSPAIMRPWIQDFTASWVNGNIDYSDEEVKAQIKALKDNGVDEYLLWNPGNNYSEGALNNNY